LFTMELTLQYPQAKFEADNELSDANVISKYKIAANIVNGMLVDQFFLVVAILLWPLLGPLPAVFIRTNAISFLKQRWLWSSRK
jgi:hypothetical protein